MAKKPTTCPGCGGPKRGRGFTHKDGCKAIPLSTKYRKKGKRQAPQAPRSGKGIDLQTLRGMSLEELFALRRQVAEAIRAHPEFKELVRTEPESK
jgi:hypothetical protein